MAAFNGPIRVKRSTVSGEVPSGADLQVGELAGNTADGKLFIKHSDGSIKEIAGGGDVESVNGEIGAVQIGTTNLTDVRYPPVSSTFYAGDWAKVSDNSAGTMNDGTAVNKSTYFRFAQIGTNSEDTLQAFKEWVEGYFNVDFPAQGATTPVPNIEFEVNWNSTVYTPTATGVHYGSTGTNLYVQIDVVDDMDINPSNFDHRIYIPGMRAAVGGWNDGEILQWNNPNNTWEPVALATVGTTGSYNDLTDLPVITAAPVDSVNGETGVVSLGIQDMDDFAPLLSAGSTWNHSSDNSNNADITNSGATNGKVTTDQDGASYNQYTLWVGDVDSNGINRKADMLQAITDGAVLSVYYDGVLAFTDTVTSPGGSANQYGRVALSFAGGNFFFPPSVGTTVGLALPGSPALPLVADDILKWDNAEQAFRPTQLATVATSGSYNDLTDQPTIPTIPVDSVNGETGAVSLGIQDMNDYGLTQAPGPGLLLTIAPEADADGLAETPINGNPFIGNFVGYYKSGADATLLSTAAAVGETVTFTAGDGTEFTQVIQANASLGATENYLRVSDPWPAAFLTTSTIHLTGPAFPGTVDVPLAHDDVLRWNDFESRFENQPLATVASSGSYSDLSDAPQNLVQIDTSTVLEGGQIYWDGTQWVAGVPPLSRGDGGDFDGGTIQTQANAEVFGGGDFDSGTADSPLPFDGGEIT